MYFLNNSVCKDCQFRISRVISSEGLVLDGLEDDDISIDLWHEYCVKLHLELDHVVVACPLYKTKYNVSDYFFVNRCIADLTKDK